MKRFFPKAAMLAISSLLLLSSAYAQIGDASLSGNTVKIGVNVPLTGSYSDQGKDEKRAYELAVERINAQGGILGKKLTLIVMDTQTNARTASKNAIKMIREHNVAMMTGGSSSAVAIAQSDVCQKYGVVFMAALTHSNATTGHMHLDKWSTVQKAHRHTFRWYFNAWMTSEALVPFMINNYGKSAKYHYITADYTWGHTLEESLRRGTELAGCETMGTVLTPLGSRTFAPELAKAGESEANVLVLLLFGRDMVTALKEADSMGLKEKMQIVVPLMELNMAYGAGAKAIEGVVATKNWYWGLKDKFPGSKEFVDAFRAKYNKAPGSAAASAWVAIYQWVDAARRAGSFASDSVIKALEGHKFTLLKGEEQWRDWDHQAISSVFIVRGKKASESRDRWDLLEILEEVEGAKVMRSREQNPVTLEKLPSELF